MIKEHDDLDKYLSKSELDNLKYLNDKSNIVKDLEYTNSDIMNIPLKQLIEKWSKINVLVFNELIEFISRIRNYSNYFEDIDETENIITGVIKFIVDLLKIFTKNDRGIYIGITFIILSVFLYFIGISS
tara:strand:+ start:203 stop:589 length:387 start_codon:yes stop_codon:yes gene_type:complete